MLCDECGKLPAEVLMTAVVNGQTTSRHLCRECIKKYKAGDLQGVLAAVLSTILILVAETVFSKLEYYILATARSMNVFVEYSDPEALDSVLKMIKNSDAVILDLEITKSGMKSKGNSTAILSLQTTRRTKHEQLLTDIARTEGILSAEEL